MSGKDDSHLNCLELNSGGEASEGLTVKYLKFEDVMKNIESVCPPELARSLVNSNSDLDKGKYEGGLKLWECAVDLCHFLQSLPSDTFKGKTVMELGCGAGLPGILALLLGAQKVIFQDFNREVLDHYTKPNIRLNSGTEAIGSSSSATEFISGDWSDMCPDKVPAESVDYILTAETIYATDSYPSLHQIMAHSLKPDGRTYLAAKNYYFGVGGSVGSWKAFLSEQKIFKDPENVWKTSATVSVPRVVLQFNKS